MTDGHYSGRVAALIARVGGLFYSSLTQLDRACAAEVKMPSGRVDKPVIIDNQNGTVSIQYEPREEGLHELHIKYNHEHVQGTCA